MITGNEGRFGFASRIGNFLSETPEVPLLLILVAFYIFIANYFAWPSTFTGGLQNFSGGSDPYWNSFMIQYILSHKHMLTFTTAINYPLGTWNPRNGTFHWMIIFVATLFSPFYNVYNGAAFGLLEIDAIFGALLIIPVYLITNEVFGKKSAMLAAILYTLMPSNFSSGILSDGRTEHTPILLFALFTIYFFIRTMHYVSKDRIFPSLWQVQKYPHHILSYIRENRLGTIYAFLTAATLGSLMVGWQGFAYIEAIIAVYVIVQLLMNLVTRRPTGYITFVSAIIFGFSLLMGYYYYITLHELSPWWTSAFYIAVIAIGFSVVINIIGNKPWIITLPLLVILSAAGLFVLNIVDPSAVSTILAGDGYFIRTRVYQTIAEASSPALGTYISGFGVAQFLLGMAGVVYTVYLFLKKKSDLLLVFAVFALVSIYMSFSAARFNITAGPAYAAMGGATLAFFATLFKMSDIKRRTPTEASGIRKAIRGNISWGRMVFVLIAVVLVIIPSGFGVINASVPANTASSVNQQIYSSLPSFMKPLVNYSSTNDQFVGTYSFYITNNSQAEPSAFNWLSTQDTNVPLDQRPAFVSWWDYGFQELVQGQHPSVADDFQQGYEVGGQTLLAQNQSQILSLWVGRILQGEFSQNSNNLTSGTVATMQKYLGQNETTFLQNVLGNAGHYSYLIAQHPEIYGKYIQTLTGQNPLFILFTGSLSTQYSLDTLVNLYQALEADTGYNIQYIYIDQGLFPQSGVNPGIFYAPTYLTDHPSYSYHGEIVPYQYYQIYATTENGSQYQLNQTPSTAIVTAYNIAYTPAFYNTTIYRLEVGYPASALGSTNGIPGLTVNTTSQVMPDWNMSNFELIYAGVPWNPYTNYQNHSTAWTVIPIQTAYKYQQEKKGTVVLLPTLSSVMSGWDTISAYYPGAEIQGKITLADGTPAAGVYLTIFDQYGIPHQIVKTNSAGYYNLTGLPGNDSVYISTGQLNQQYLIGGNVLGAFNVNISKQQAERMVPVNSIGGVSGYKISKDYVVSSGSLSGTVTLQTVGNTSSADIPVSSGSLFFQNVASSTNYTVSITSGNYQLPSAVPGTYNVSLITDNGTLANFTVENVTTSAITANLVAKMDTIFAIVTAGNTPLTGVEVYADSGLYRVSSLTNSSGIAVIGVGPGNYSVSARGSGFISWKQNATFDSWNLNTTLALVPTPMVNVTGTISGASSATIILMKNGIFDDNYSTLATGGKFSISLPAGYYTIYAQSGSLVAAATSEFTSNRNIALTLSQSHSVNISAASASSVLEHGYFEAMSTNGMIIQSPTSSTNYFNFLLPDGIYGFAASFQSTGLTLTGFKSFQILGNLSFSVQVGYQSNLTVSVSSSIASSTGTNPPVSDGVVEVYQAGIPVFYSSLANTGTVSLAHPFGNLTPYAVSFVGPGFANASRTVLGDVQSLSMVTPPFFSNLSFNLQSATSIPVTGSVTLSGTQSYNLTLVNNMASGTLLPGVYVISVSPATGKVNLSSNILVVPYSASYSNFSNYVQYFSITSSSEYLQVFDSGAQLVNAGMILPGTYTVYSYSATESNLSVVSVTESLSLTPNLLPSVDLNLSNSAGLSGGTYSIQSGKAVVSTSGSSILLPYGIYTVSYVNNYSASGKDYASSGTTTVSLYKYSAVNVPLSIRTVTTTLTGMVTYNGAPVPYSQVKIFNSSGSFVLNTTTDKTGNYSVQLSGGTYTVYAYFSSYRAAGFSYASIPAFSGGVVQNISMTNAYSVYISETKQGVLLTGNITIVGVDATLLYNTTQQNILLPGGTYSFTGSAKYSQQNFTGGSITVYWNSSTTNSISETTYVNIILTRVTEYSYSSGMISNISTVAQGSNLTSQIFYLVNNGNSVVNVTFSSGLEDLNVTVNRSKIQLAPDENVTLSANLGLPAKMNAGQDLLPVIASYGTGNYTINLKVNISANPGFTEYLNPAKNFAEGTSYVVPVFVQNTGNTKLKLNVTFNDSEAANYSWKANLSATGVNYTQLSLAPFQTETVYLNVTPLGGNYFSSGTIHLIVRSSTGNTSTLPVQVVLPSQAKVIISPGGTAGVSSFTGNPIGTLLIGIIIIVVAVVGGLVGASYRGRKNRR